jgi:hypothetical protein
MPHVPMMVEPSPMGPYCGYCGPLQPVFMCTICGTVQGLYLQGQAAPPPQAPGMQFIAPAVQAPQSAQSGNVAKLLEGFVGDVLSGVGKQLGQNLANSMSGWC